MRPRVLPPARGLIDYLHLRGPLTSVTRRRTLSGRRQKPNPAGLIAADLQGFERLADAGTGQAMAVLDAEKRAVGRADDEAAIAGQELIVLYF